jgi:hypothetical protein
LLAAFLGHGALGLAIAWCDQRELRASPRSVPWTRGFQALAAHELLLGVPSLTWLLLRYPDWMVGYTLHAATLPSALGLVVSLAAGALGLGGFSLGAWLLRSQRGRWVPALCAGALFVAVGILAAAASRVSVVGSYVQYRGGFGIEPLGGSRLAGSLGLLGFLLAASALHLGWTLRR